MLDYGSWCRYFEQMFSPRRFCCCLGGWVPPRRPARLTAAAGRLAGTGERCSCTTAVTDMLLKNFDLDCPDTVPVHTDGYHWAGQDQWAGRPAPEVQKKCVIGGLPWKHGARRRGKRHYRVPCCAATAAQAIAAESDVNSSFAYQARCVIDKRDCQPFSSKLCLVQLNLIFCRGGRTFHNRIATECVVVSTGETVRNRWVGARFLIPCSYVVVAAA